MGRILMVGPSESLFDELRGHAGVREHDVQSCAMFVDALRHLRQQSWDVLLTDPDTTIGDSLAVAAEVSLLHPSLRIIALWPAATNQEIIAAMRVMAAPGLHRSRQRAPEPRCQHPDPAISAVEPFVWTRRLPC